MKKMKRKEEPESSPFILFISPNPVLISEDREPIDQKKKNGGEF